MTRLAKGAIIAGTLITLGTAGIIAYSGRFKAHFEELARQQIVQYLEKRFESDVKFEAIRLRFPSVSRLTLLFKQGRGTIATVEGYGLVLHHRNALDLPPLFKLPKFRFDLDLGVLSIPEKSVTRLELEGMEINIPPKGRRPLKSGDSEHSTSENKVSVVIKEVDIARALLIVLPKDSQKPPLRFEIARLRLEDAGPASAMKYRATLTNPRPKGLIESSGVFGPWNADEPSDTNLAGNYDFTNADLSVFKAISGILDSTGKFDGSLGEIHVTGQARVPDFSLKRVKQGVPLTTDFEVQVDGTNGNTLLKRVNAQLGVTHFVTGGAVIKHEDVGRHVIHVNATMRQGQMRDVLRLAVQGPPFMEGRLDLDTTIAIPPESRTVREKLILDGVFSVARGVFTRDAIQDKVDELSRRGRGDPKNFAINDVVSNMRGKFHMEDEMIALPNVAFDVPGATVGLAGVYDMDAKTVDFHGDLRLDAKVSQTLTGWKRWLAKPADPFFAKDGAGTLLKIAVTGPASHPQFGLDRGNKISSIGGKQ